MAVSIRTVIPFLAVVSLIGLCSSQGDAHKKGETRDETAGYFIEQDAGQNPPAQKAAQKYPRVEIRDTERRRLASKHTGREYEVDVFFPSGYYESAGHFPVLYVLGSEYNFGCVAYITRRLIKNKDIRPVLLVGLAYDSTEEEYYSRRMLDSTPTSKIHGRGTGGAEPFTLFLEKELIPFVDANYRTVKDDRTIAGLSIEGFYCCYVLFEHPGLFQKFIIVSPSLWFSNGVIFDYEQEYFQGGKDLPAEVHLSAGGLEGPSIKDNAVKFGRTVEGRGYKGLRMRTVIMEGEHHRSVFPFAFTRGLQFLFQKVVKDI